MHYEKRHPVLKTIGLTLLLILLALLCWAAAARGDLLPGFLSVGAFPVAEGIGEQLPSGSLAVFQRDMVPGLGRAAVFNTDSGLRAGWVISEQPLTAVSGADAFVLGQGALRGTVRWSLGWLGAALLFLQRFRWLVFGFTAGILAVLVYFAATAKRRRHARKVKQMLEIFERTARRYESDEEDF